MTTKNSDLTGAKFSKDLTQKMGCFWGAFKFCLVPFWLGIVLIILPRVDLQSQEALPVGNHPPALQFDHFPNAVYAMVWRNWNLVNPERIALTLGCSVEAIHTMAESMGLPAAQPIVPALEKQIYITVLRRNWHLLPYEQLLILLNFSEKELEFALKEDDFLFVKFGNLKPDCPPLKYSPPDQKALARADEIKDLVNKHFQKILDRPAEPLFAFIDDLSTLDKMEVIQSSDEINDPGLRYIYSYFGVFGDPLVDTLQDPYPEGLLQKLAAKGINGIWMHVVLNQMAPGGPDFPEFGLRHQDRLKNLNRIAERAAKYGIKIYLYMNEPRAMPPSFFEKRADLVGIKKDDFVTMCTSNPPVLRWITNALQYVFQEVPDLGGVFTISASENLTSCASHGLQHLCSKCSKREYADIIAEVNTAIARGVQLGNPKAKVIVWDWGWHGHRESPDIIAKLPKSVWLMSVSEWALPIERGGIPSSVGEYSISAVGPGPKAQYHWSQAKAAGLKTVAKVQFNNTWELSAIPWIPVLDLVAQHAANLARVHIDGFMLSWSLGGYPSPNLEIAQHYSREPGADPSQVLDKLAIARYGSLAAPFARKAWTAFSLAFKEFPYHQKVVYSGPQQYGPANLLYAKPTGYTSTMVGFPYDDLQGWGGVYPVDILIDQFDKVAVGWQEGLDYFMEVLKASDADKREQAEADWRIAKAAYLHFASSAAQGHFIGLRDSLLKNGENMKENQTLREMIRHLLDEEIKHATELLEIVRSDSRIGFEASNQYYYVSQDLMEKVINCEFLRKNYLD